MFCTGRILKVCTLQYCRVQGRHCACTLRRERLLHVWMSVAETVVPSALSVTENTWCVHLLQLSRILSMSTFRAFSSCVPSVSAGTWSSSSFMSSTAAHSRNCMKVTGFLPGDIRMQHAATHDSGVRAAGYTLNNVQSALLKYAACSQYWELQQMSCQQQGIVELCKVRTGPAATLAAIGLSWKVCMRVFSAYLQPLEEEGCPVAASSCSAVSNTCSMK